MEQLDKLDQLKQEITALVADILEIDVATIEPNARFVEDLDMDSMMALEILAGIEKKFKIQIPEENLPKMTSVNQAAEVAKAYLK